MPDKILKINDLAVEYKNKGSYSFDRCRKEDPELKKIASNHLSACFLNES